MKATLHECDNLLYFETCITANAPCYTRSNETITLFANSAPNYGSKTKLLLITTHQE